MRLFAYFRSVVAKFFHHSQVADDMDEEFRSHVRHRADDLERSGLGRAEAERRARIEFGGHDRFKEDSYEALGGNFIETFLQDLRFSLRLLRKSPGFTIAAILTLALAIGANAVVFGVLNAMILRPINVPQAQSLYAIERGGDKSVTESYPDYLDLRDRNRSFDDIAAYNVSGAGLDTGKEVLEIWGCEVTGNYFDVLGIKPYLGRFFHASDEKGLNSAPYIVLPYAYWHAQFHDDRSVVGRVVRLNKHPYTIIGVAPPDFQGTLLFLAPNFWVPLVDQEQVEGSSGLRDRGNREKIVMVMGHLKPGVTPAQAVADLNVIGSYLEKTYPKDDSNMTFSLTRPYLAGDWLGGPIREFLTALMLLAGLILLAACANLASLFAARAADRGREVALRLALGSSRRRILRQVLTEGVLISLVGGAVGLLGSLVLLRALSVWRPLPSVDVLHVPVAPDAKVYLLALLLALASGFFFGLVPVRQILRTNPYEVVKSGTTGAVRRAVGLRVSFRDLLLVVQIAICAVLVTSSLVAVRGLILTLQSNFGFEPRNAFLVGPDLTSAGYIGDTVAPMQKRMIEALQAIPGVTAVGSIDRPPLYYGANTASVFTDKTADLRPSNSAAEATIYNISPRYFDAARTTFLAGRDLSWHDDKNAPRVAVVNREFAHKVLDTDDPIGRYFKRSDGTRIQVVGMVEDGKYASLTEEPRPAMFLPVTQSPPAVTTLVVRSGRDTQQMSKAISATLHKLDSGLPVVAGTWNDALDGELFAARMATISLSVLGIMGAVLAITGIFGMTVYSVSKRLRELGIRIALGAQRTEVWGAALGRAIKLLAFGSIAGLVLGLLATKVLAYIVYQATPRDPLVLTGVVLVMSLLGLLATWIPAQRALSVDPLILLREE
jgi:predicted permease